uniref:Major sperm protein n=1 Tax=Parascaris univalens TaxID=6257 RepID=A0A915C568_PARUN
MSSSEVQNHLNSLIYNERHFTARGLRYLKETSGIEEFTLALLITLITSFYLIIGESAQFVANTLLTIVPLLLTYFYPEEKPPNQQLLIYWGSFALITLLDPSYHDVKGYYFIKVLLLSLLFLRPFKGAEWILERLHQLQQHELTDEVLSRSQHSQNGLFTKDEIREMERKSIGSKSPPPEPPEPSFSKEPRKERAELLTESNALKVVKGVRSTPVQPSFLSVSSHQQCDEIVERGDIAKEYYNSKSTIGKTLQTSSNSMSIVKAMNPDDLYFEPSQNLIFNAPFNDHDTTYYMRIQNTSMQTIAFAVKSNAIQRLSVDPPSGVLKPKSALNIAVTVKRFDYNNAEIFKDRIKFEYVYCPSGTKKFSHKLLQQSDFRRHKNIFIRYNP